MGFRGQEGAWSAKWETLRDDVHEAELAAYEVDARVARLAREVHRREHPVDARTVRWATLLVVVGAIVLAPRVALERPLLPEVLGLRLGALMVALVWVGPAVLHLLVGRPRAAGASVVARVAGAFLLREYDVLPRVITEQLSFFDLLALATVIEAMLTLGRLAPLQRPKLPRAPSVPAPPVGANALGWQRAAEAMEQRVTFAHEHRARTAEREPLLRARLDELDRRPTKPVSVVPFALAFVAAGWIYLETHLLFAAQLWFPGLGIALVHGIVTPASIRGWSQQERPIGALLFFLARASVFTFELWGGGPAVSWWFLPISMLEPVLIAEAAKHPRHARA